MNGTVLERASHDYAVEIIKTASNPVEFVVQSLVEDSLDNSDTGIIKTKFGNLVIAINHMLYW